MVESNPMPMNLAPFATRAKANRSGARVFRLRSLAQSSALALVAAVGGMLPSAGIAQTLPVVSVNGGATISTAANVMTVNLNDANRVVQWTTFNIGNTVGEAVNFTSPNLVTPFAVLNRVVTAVPSVINGPITGQSNIGVWLVNPTGITFGGTGSFNGASLVLSTLPIADADFLNGGAANFAGASTSGITLTAGAGAITSSGSVVIGAANINAGKAITATGDVALVTAANFDLPLGVGSPLSVQINAGTAVGTAQIDVTGAISGASVRLAGASTVGIASLLNVGAAGSLVATAAGGTVILATKTNAAGAVTVNSAAVADGINLAGSANASGVGGDTLVSANGAIVTTGGLLANDRIDLDGGSINVNAASVSLTSATSTGGALSLVASAGNVAVDTASATGGGATVTASLGVRGRAAGGRAAVSATGAGNNVAITATGGQALLGAVSADAAATAIVSGKSVDVNSAGVSLTSATSTGGALSLVASAGN
uniref:beta strand repeat-containing protein n=1 Tax=Novosphingobium sp. Chol11 TaxID=1385763 RepID=UPI0025D3AFE8